MKKEIIADFYRSFGKMLGTGIPVAKTLEALKQDNKFSELEGFFDYLLTALRLGKELHVSFAHAGFPLDQVEALHKACSRGELDYRSEGLAQLAEAGSDFDITIPEEISNRENETIALLNDWIKYAVDNNASDLHIIPTVNKILIKFRIDGVLTDHDEMDKSYLPLIASRFKTMANCDVAEKRLPQDGRILVRVEGEECDIRISLVPACVGEKITARFLPKNRTIIGFKELAIPGKEMEEIRKMMDSSHGLILITGPTGCGKTTTCYSMLKEYVERNLNVVTSENPVEYCIEGATQIHARPQIGLSTLIAARALMRTDPDVIFFSEFPSEDHINLALKAAQTGHLVIGVTHCRDVLELVEMLVSLVNIDHAVLANILTGVVAQFLVRKLCTCKKKEKASSKIEKRYDVKSVYEPVGCDNCLNSGYRGRSGVFETCIPDKDLKEAIAGKNLKRVRKILRSMLADNAMKLVEKGVTSVTEVERCLGSI